MGSQSSARIWPDLSLPTLAPTLETLQLWTQIVGKLRLKPGRLG